MGTGDEEQTWKFVEGSTCAVKTEILRSEQFGDMVWRETLFDLGELRDVGNSRVTGRKTYSQYSPECFVQTTPPENTEEGYERWVLSRPS